MSIVVSVEMSVSERGSWLIALQSALTAQQNGDERPPD